MKRKLLVAAVALVALAGLGTIVEPSVGGSPVAVAANVEGVCQPQDQHQKPSSTTKSITVTAPSGFLITGYCVKAGSDNQGDGPYYSPYFKPTTSVTFSHPSGKDISHYVIFLAPIPPETDVPAPTTEPTLTPPTCDAPGSFVAPPSTNALEYSTTEENGVITITVTAKPGFVVSGTPGPWTKAVSELAQLTGEGCETTPPDDPEVDSEGPVPPTMPPAPATRVESSPPAQAAPPAGATSLPVTGSTSWLLSGIALATLLTGLSLTRWSRRPDEQTA